MGPIANPRSRRSATVAAVTGSVVLILAVLVSDIAIVGLDEIGIDTFLSPHWYVGALFQCLLFVGLPVFFAIRFGGAVGLAMIWSLLILIWTLIAILVIRDASFELLRAAPGLIMMFLAWGYFALGVGAGTEVYFERLEPLSNSYRRVAVWLFPWILGTIVAVGLLEIDSESVLAMPGGLALALLAGAAPLVLSGMFLVRLLRSRRLEGAAV